MGKKPVREPDRLCPLEMRIPWHQNIKLGLSPRDTHLGDREHDFLKMHELLPKPDTHGCCNLLIARTTSVQLSRYFRADQLAQASLIGRVDIFIECRTDGKCRTVPFLFDLLKTDGELCALLLCDETSVGQGLGIGKGSLNICFVEGFVKWKGFVKGDHDFIHATYCSVSPISLTIEGNLGARRRGKENGTCGTDPPTEGSTEVHS